MYASTSSALVSRSVLTFAKLVSKAAADLIASVPIAVAAEATVVASLIPNCATSSAALLN